MSNQRARALLLLLATAALAAPLDAQRAGYALRKVQYRANLNDRGYLRVWNLAGTTRITAWDKDSVVVRGSIPADQDFACGGRTTAMKCFVNAKAVDDDGGPGATLEIMVPRHIQLWVKSATADISIAGFDGSVDAYSVSGAIRVDGHAQALALESMAGSITVAASAATLHAKTASGDIIISGTVEDVEGTTVSGILKVTGASFQRGRFESIDGAIHWEGAPAPGSSLEFGSHSGTIELMLPSSTAGDFTVSTFQGSVRNEFGSAKLLQGRDLNGRELHFTLRGDERTRVVIRNFKGKTLLSHN